LFWRNACVSYSVDQAASKDFPLDTLEPLAEQAFNTWSNTQCPASGQKVGITPSNIGTVSCGTVAYDTKGPNHNVITIRDDKWPYSDGASTLGLTTVTYNPTSGEIYDADMEINAVGTNLSVGDPVPADGHDLLGIITHEAGHFLGLAHATNPAAT